MMTQLPTFKIPRSVLVVVYALPADVAGHAGPADTADTFSETAWHQAQVLLLERAGHAGFWQSVTGSLDHIDEPFEDCAAREVLEETGIDAAAPGCLLHDWQLENVYEIYPQWRWRYAPHVSHNTERVFGLRVPQPQPIELSTEHTAYEWLPIGSAMQRCFSPSNTEAISWLPRLGSVSGRGAG